MPLVELDLGPNGVHSFEDVGQLKDWVDDEERFWQWLIQSRESRICTKARDVVNEAVARHKNFAGEVQQQAGKQGEKAAVAQFKASVESDYASRQLFHKSSSIAGYIWRVMSTNKYEGSYALAYFQRADPAQVNLSSGEGLRGYIEAMLWERGDVNSVEQFRNDIDQSRTKFAGLIAEMTMAKANWTKAHTEQVEAFAADLKQTKERIEGEFLAIKSIQEPANYWKSKRCWSNVFAGIWGIATIVTAWAGGSMVFDLANKLPKDDLAADKYIHLLPHLIPLALAAIALFWVLRILVRLLLSSLHMAADASERILIIKTFQSLMSAKAEGADKIPLEVVWNQVFRHCPSGLTKDDAAPQIPQELITRVGK